MLCVIFSKVLKIFIENLIYRKFQFITRIINSSIFFDLNQFIRLILYIFDIFYKNLKKIKFFSFSNKFYFIQKLITFIKHLNFFR